jgi:serine/threonine protein kinase
MSASTSSVAVPPASARQWLDALVSGACDPPAFLRGVDTLVQGSGDEAWEVLSLLDQYYRRGKLPLEQFRSLKAHVDRIALAAPPSAEPAASQPPAIAPLPAVVAAKNDAVIPEVTPVEATDAAAEPPADARDAASVGGAPTIGAVLRGRYELVGVLGKGGMGTVFEAVDRFRVDLPQASHRLAVKVMHTSVVDKPELFDELRSEFQHLQSLSHPNIVRVHEFDRDGETTFFTMELLNGIPLNRLFGMRKDAEIARPYALSIIRDIGAAVVHAHSRNVVHGDLNPLNIFVTEAGEVRVLDFGAAHKLKRGPWVSDFETEQQVSAATPAFGSCQVLEGETADVRDDVFSFACVMYMLLTGRHPFQSRTAIQARTLRLVPPRPRGLSPRQWRWLRAGLAFERDRRPLDVEQWLKDLHLRGAAPHLPNLAALASEPPRRDYSSLYLALALGLVAIAGIALWTKTRQAAPVGIHLATDAATRAASDADVTADTEDAANTRDSAAAPENAETPARKSVPREAPASQPAAPASVAPARTASLTPPPPKSAAPKTEDDGDVRATAPRSRIELAAVQIEVMPGEPVARVTLRRKGNLKGDVSFMWWTEPGTAKSGIDFAASAPHLEHMGNGQNLDTLLIPIVSNPARHEERNFYLVIDDGGPDSGAAVIGHTTAMITIAPQE